MQLVCSVHGISSGATLMVGAVAVRVPEALVGALPSLSGSWEEGVHLGFARDRLADLLGWAGVARPKGSGPWLAISAVGWKVGPTGGRGVSRRFGGGCWAGK